MEMKESLWNGFKRLDFEFDGYYAIVVLPDEDKKCGKWLLKTVYFDAFPEFEIEMVKRGWALAYVHNKTRWCLESDLDRKKAFADFIIKEFDLYEKCVPVGMSCGGLYGIKFAAKYPSYVSALYLDAPVVNLLSTPAFVGRVDNLNHMEEFVNATGITLSQLLSYREHPLDKIPALIENDIPIILVYGEADTVVPYNENGALLEKAYRENGKTIVTIGKPGCEHHPHGLDDNSPIIDFVLKHQD